MGAMLDGDSVTLWQEKPVNDSLTDVKSVEWLGFEFCQDEVDLTGYPALNCHWETEEEFEENMPLPKKLWENFANNCDLNDDGKSGNIYDIVMLRCYTLLNDDDVFNESANKEFMISKQYRSNFALLDSLDIERSGDSNLDGETDLADAVLIMQTNANPDKYTITNSNI